MGPDVNAWILGGVPVHKALLMPDEYDGAFLVGRSRFDEARRRQQTPAYGCSLADALRRDQFGACCEWAAAKALGLPFPTHLNTEGLPDLPPDIQVRGTRVTQDMRLHVFKRDKPGQRYILVYQQPGSTLVFYLMGWIQDTDAKRDDWLGRAFNRPKTDLAWRVPLQALLVIDTFGPGRPRPARGGPAEAYLR